MPHLGLFEVIQVREGSNRPSRCPECHIPVKMDTSETWKCGGIYKSVHNDEADIVSRTVMFCTGVQFLARSSLILFLDLYIGIGIKL